VQLRRGGSIQLFVPFAGGNAGPRTVAVKAGGRVTIHDVLADDLIVRLPGPATICGRVTWTP
jgi:hypothetical protein